jgi:hypothetical protein
MASLFAAVLGLGSVLLGTMILIGGPRRMAGPSFLYVTNLAPWWVWGTGFVTAGVLASVGQWRRLRRVAAWGHRLSAAGALYWVGAFIYGASITPTASLTGIGAYTTLGLLHVIASYVLFRER